MNRTELTSAVAALLCCAGFGQTAVSSEPVAAPAHLTAAQRDILAAPAVQAPSARRSIATVTSVRCGFTAITYKASPQRRAETWISCGFSAYGAAPAETVVLLNNGS